MNVQFRTGTAEIEPHFARQLDDLAYAMSLSPELMLDLTGYADRRGNSDYNQTLSEQRVEAVKSYLVSQALPKSVCKPRLLAPVPPSVPNRAARATSLTVGSR